MSGDLAKYDSVPYQGEHLFPIQTTLTANEFRILYKLLWTAEANVLNEVFRKILADRNIIHEVVLTDDELQHADDTITSLIRKLNLIPPQRADVDKLALENTEQKELPHDSDIP